MRRYTRPFSLSFYQMLLKSRYPVLVLSLELKAFKDIYACITWRYSSKYVPLTSSSNKANRPYRLHLETIT